jgi:sigma-B regulation protein RsbQ
MDSLLKSLESNFTTWSESVGPVIMGNPERPELAAELVQSFCSHKPDIARHFARATFTSDNRADLPKLQVPSLILQCSNDAIAPEIVGQYVHKNLKNSVFHHLKAQGHCPHLSAPEETIEAIRSHLL